MRNKRREFIRTTGMVAAGALVMPWWSCRQAAGGNEQQGAEADSTAMDAAPAGTLTAFGIQLYTLRSEMDKDPAKVLRQVASFGYKQVENYEGRKGLWWDMGHKGMKSLCDELGLELIASHCNFTQNFEEKAAQAAEVGMRYLIAPWVGPQKSIDDFKRIAETFNKCGEVCKTNGLRFAYHNHDYSFKELEGQLPQDVLMQNTDPALVDFEMDIYWVVTAGADPVEWLKRYPNRFKLSHVKDRKKDAPPEEKDASCILGQGSIDFASILAVAKQQGMEYYIVEQERYDDSTPFDSAKADAAYMKSLVF
ncbi:MAG: sugar phosphate isomerase [Saprospiraceae bacterium]|nr:MAG: sugar phosphate isomerase [Saprospiraceae bacterium]